MTKTADWRNVLAFAACQARIDLRNHFRRTRLGTLWNALGVFAAIGALTTFFGTVLRDNLPTFDAYVPFVGFGVIVWHFLSAVVGQSCAAYSTRARAVRHTAYPFAAIPLSATLRNAVVLLQNLLIGTLALVTLYGLPQVQWGPLLGGLLLLVPAAFSLAAVSAVLCVRFRDLPQLVSGAMHLAFFLTPIIWMEHFLGRYVWLLDWNPFHHLLAVVRGPLTGNAPSTLQWAVAAGLAVGGGAVALAVLRAAARRIPYWL